MARQRSSADDAASRLAAAKTEVNGMLGQAGPGELEGLMEAIGPEQTWNLGTPARLSALIEQNRRAALAG